MEADLRELIATIQNPHLRALLDARVRRGTATWSGYRDAPAAKRYHQAYRHGLLEHSLTVAQAVSAISATFPGIDRDVAVTGALLHDIGKLDAYELDGRRDLDVRRRAGCTARSRSATTASAARSSGSTASRPSSPRRVLHIILSHHGSLEHGSPVVPCTREATLVHMIDNLGGRLGQLRPAREGAAAPASSGRPMTRPSAAARTSRRRRELRARSGMTSFGNAALRTASKDRK